MEKTNELLEIEKNFDVDRPKVSSMSAWPFLRQKVYFEIMRKKYGFNSRLRTTRKMQLVKNVLYGIHNIFKIGKFDYLFFSNADKRILEIEKAKYDIFFDAWADKLGQERSLFIEWAIKEHHQSKLTYSKNVISDLVFKFGCTLFSFFTRANLANLDCLEKIKQRYQIEFDTEKELQNKLGEVRFYRFLFKFIKPKAIFLISSFTKVSIVVAAHYERIMVYEAQHGFIGTNHQFYNSYYDFGQLFYPDCLIAFGTSEKSRPTDRFIFKPHQILPVGSQYLESIKNNYCDNYLSSLREKYTKLFCVTLQAVKEKELLAWVSNEAKKNREWLFILKPRNYEHLDYSQYTSSENIVLLPKYNVYKILKYSDYNITVYSTVAVEAEMFGVKTLFYNIDNLSTKYFDVDKMFADRINSSNGTIGPEELEYNTNVDPYFILGYPENVKNAKLF